MKKTYKDFKVGDILTCVKLDCDGYIGSSPDNDRLILGEGYGVTDVDYHFPDRVCVKLKGPYYFHEEFVPIECFTDIIEMRNSKIDSILSK